MLSYQAPRRALYKYRACTYTQLCTLYICNYVTRCCITIGYDMLETGFNLWIWYNSPFRKKQRNHGATKFFRFRIPMTSWCLERS